ncbi:MAG: Gfo/Idh/MocA family oxidoreductase [Opitutaceae bacterium]
MTVARSEVPVPVGLGILGFAHGHVGLYCREWRGAVDSPVRLIAGWDHDRDRLKASCDGFGLEAEASVESLLARGEIAAVVIAAETSMHADLVEAAAAAGKTIILQKPLALTMEEADRVVAAVDRHGVRFTLAWQMRVDPENLEIKRLIAAGVVGRVLMMRRRHGLKTHRMKGFEESWHVRPELNRGIWADDASHAIDFLYWLFGSPRTVMAEIDTLLNPRVPDDHGIAVFRYDDGLMAEVVSSFTCVAGENTTEVIGETGVIIQNFGDQPSAGAPKPPGAIALKWFTEAENRWQIAGFEPPESQGVRIAGLAGPLAEFAVGRRPPIATAREGRDVLRMTLACHRSAESGRRVLIEES